MSSTRRLRRRARGRPADRRLLGALVQAVPGDRAGARERRAPTRARSSRLNIDEHPEIAAATACSRSRRSSSSRRRAAGRVVGAGRARATSALRAAGLAEVLPAGELDRLAVERHTTPSPASQRPITGSRAVGRPPRAARSPRRSRDRRACAAASGTRSSSITTRQPERRGDVRRVHPSPSEMSSIACATAASRRPSSSRSGGRTYRSSRNAAPAAAERPCDDEQVAGSRAGPARDALRPPERRHATARRVPARVVSPPTTATRPR